MYPPPNFARKISVQIQIGPAFPFEFAPQDLNSLFAGYRVGRIFSKNSYTPVVPKIRTRFVPEFEKTSAVNSRLHKERHKDGHPPAGGWPFFSAFIALWAIAIAVKLDCFN